MILTHRCYMTTASPITSSGTATTNHEEPFYKRLSLSLLSIALICLALFLGQEILVPIFFSMLLSTLLLPIANFLTRKGFNRTLSIALSLIVSLTLLFGILYFLITQVANFLDDSDLIKHKFNDLVKQTQRWVSENLNVGIKKQNQYIHDTAEKMKTSGPALVGQTFLSITQIFSYIIFIPIYTFLLMHYKDLIKKFLIDLFKRTSPTKVMNIIHECQTVSLYYITGLLIEMSIVFALNAVGFLILGIQYAIFLALVAALLNLIPYVGMLVANVFCMVITLLFSPDLSSVFWVGVILALVQLIDNNILMPLIVGNKVRINALATVIGVLLGGALCGVAGMFLAIPGVAVLKVIFDRIEFLKPWGLIMGDVNDNHNKKIVKLKKLK